MTQPFISKSRYDDDREPGLSWSRIAGYTLVIAVHLFVVLLLLAPVSTPKEVGKEEEVTRVVIICLLYTSPSPRD